MNTAGLAQALDHPNAQAFLRLLRWCEGTGQTDDAYRMFFGGALFDSLSDHPRRTHTFTMKGRPISSTAAGAYQFLSRTWDECAKALALPDFGPRSQDLAALFLIRRRGALDDVLAGRIEVAIQRCAREWASLPGSPYGQPVKTLAECLRVYQQHGGALAGQPMPTPAPAPSAPPAPAQTPPRLPWWRRLLGAAAPEPTPAPLAHQETEMPLPAFIAAALPAVVQAIPELAKLFGSGSEVAERNVRAAQIAVDIARDATGARNAQEAAELLQADPEARQRAADAVMARWFELSEVGGGVEAARRADQAAMQGDGPWWAVMRSPSFLVSLLLLPLVYLIVLSIIGAVGSVQWSADVRAAIAGTIVGTIVGGLVGYYYGQTTSRNRTPA